MNGHQTCTPVVTVYGTIKKSKILWDIPQECTHWDDFVIQTPSMSPIERSIVLHFFRLTIEHQSSRKIASFIDAAQKANSILNNTFQYALIYKSSIVRSKYDNTDLLGRVYQHGANIWYLGQDAQILIDDVLRALIERCEKQATITAEALYESIGENDLLRNVLGDSRSFVNFFTHFPHCVWLSGKQSDIMSRVKMIEDSLVNAVRYGIAIQASKYDGTDFLGETYRRGESIYYYSIYGKNSVILTEKHAKKIQAVIDRKGKTPSSVYSHKIPSKQTISEYDEKRKREIAALITTIIAHSQKGDYQMGNVLDLWLTSVIKDSDGFSNRAVEELRPKALQAKKDTEDNLIEIVRMLIDYTAESWLFLFRENSGILSNQAFVRSLAGVFSLNDLSLRTLLLNTSYPIENVKGKPQRQSMPSSQNIHVLYGGWNIPVYRKEELAQNLNRALLPLFRFSVNLAMDLYSPNFSQHNQKDFHRGVESFWEDIFLSGDKLYPPSILTGSLSKTLPLVSNSIETILKIFDDKKRGRGQRYQLAANDIIQPAFDIVYGRHFLRAGHKYIGPDWLPVDKLFHYLGEWIEPLGELEEEKTEDDKSIENIINEHIEATEVKDFLKRLWVQSKVITKMSRIDRYRYISSDGILFASLVRATIQRKSSSPRHMHNSTFLLATSGQSPWVCDKRFFVSGTSALVTSSIPPNVRKKILSESSHMLLLASEIEELYQRKNSSQNGLSQENAIKCLPAS